ncbi:MULTISPECIES: YlxR family protein [Oceanobacillus]|uniref:YlxR domain-containing protein n=1 Tax=Oceanobacillus kimchii TaxID=746691 RepID=A0ABQ5TGN8_9BACI|nr:MULTISPECIES: YlxR family protein [Oceanobacillus]OEH54698.1 RNA-binding protein [Oceanobacillus sp. E9]MBT2598671.1 YlxR family protein [Oceanobacillus sp. ISL-74]MBT2651590.1 YlxR family protein [Oceanobacillus sp. ISL-73]MCT1576239.1 YlxR family protein [Oceanobacillus kimchii]MCT2135876.1 YlxR family protein [Oceanobacillus kimchii]
MVKKKKVPERKCIVTNEMRPKKELIRVVRNKEGEVFVDPSGKKNGRGAYLSKDKEVIDQAKQTNVLNRTFNTEIDESLYEDLLQVIEGTYHES